jgi:hypothetical protein
MVFEQTAGLCGQLRKQEGAGGEIPVLMADEQLQRLNGLNWVWLS